MSQPREYGLIGLGRMGGNLTRHAMKLGIKVVGHAQEPAPEDMVKAGLVEIESAASFTKELRAPRAVFLYIPAGPAVDEVISELADILEPGDVVVDGGNSYWGDSIRRHRKLRDEHGIQLIDLGTSGGVEGALHGACFMAGGEREAVERIEPMLMELAVEGGYVHAGPPGAGHFTKLVHNGIEFGMLQAIGEGVTLLERYRDDLEVADVLSCWRNGSVIRSWLVDLMEASYRENRGLAQVPSFVDDTGEVNWLVGDALRMEVPVPVIAQSVMQLLASRDGENDSARAIAMMRHGFGGHAYGRSEPVERERREGRIGDYLTD